MEYVYEKSCGYIVSSMTSVYKLLIHFSCYNVRLDIFFFLNTSTEVINI